MSGFKRDSKIGNFYENLYTNITEWDTLIPAPNEQFLDWDMILIKNGKKSSIEIKTDLLARGTGNASIEIYGWDGYNIKPKGLMATKASSYVIFIAPENPELKDKQITEKYIQGRVSTALSSSLLRRYGFEEFGKDVEQYGLKEATRRKGVAEKEIQAFNNEIKRDLEDKLRNDEKKAERLTNPYTYYVIPTKMLKRIVKSYYINGVWEGGWFGDSNGNESSRDKLCPKYNLPSGGTGSAFNVLVPLYKLKQYKKTWRNVLPTRDGVEVVYNNLQTKEMINILPGKLEVENPDEDLAVAKVDVNGIVRAGIRRIDSEPVKSLTIAEPESLTSPEITPVFNAEAEREARREDKALRLLEYAGYGVTEEDEAEKAQEQQEIKEQKKLEEPRRERRPENEIIMRQEVKEKEKAMKARRANTSRTEDFGHRSQYEKD